MADHEQSGREQDEPERPETDSGQDRPEPEPGQSEPEPEHVESEQDGSLADELGQDGLEQERSDSVSERDEAGQPE
ncbi:hypothetical protein, partial [Propionibacterium acidifaciens]|uniref:hypothetical protein n=1 Tax=Propionibacterium acidifaciens TaxID=556499 RepID=UPI0028DC0817